MIFCIKSYGDDDDNYNFFVGLSDTDPLVIESKDRAKKWCMYFDSWGEEYVSYDRIQYIDPTSLLQVRAIVEVYSREEDWLEYEDDVPYYLFKMEAITPPMAISRKVMGKSVIALVVEKDVLGR